MAKVTVILPSLNVKDYIEETLSSVCDQTLEDIEILCVDAGSTDGTEEIIKKYERKDSRVHFIHSDMRSYGHQMNMGIELAKGEYIGILETDDYIDSNMYEDLYLLARKNKLDIVKSNYRYFFEKDNGNRFFVESDLAREFNLEYDKIFSYKEFLNGKYNNDVYIWDGIYRTDFVREKGIRFNESPGAAFQDFGFKYLTSWQAQRIMYVRDAYYNYRKDNTGSSTYNIRTVGFILDESKYVLETLGDKLYENKDLYCIIAKHVIGGHMSILNELCRWIYPNENVQEDIRGFVPLIKEFKEKKVYSVETLGMETWKQTELLINDSETYIKSMAIMLQAEGQIAIDFVGRCSKEKQIVIFGSGKFGRSALIFLKACHEGDNVVAFADNNPEKANAFVEGVITMTVSECVEKYRDALYVVASPANATSMRRQLRELGVVEDNIIAYNYSSSIFTITNGVNYCNRKRIEGF